ncbi:hypothetical protein [Rubrobacter calidifluminis]|uniref:hypothetical protein n=1 Tax=Rubrobacter calidifluminis TaxID=1392640 RepID=UPI003B592138
MTLLLTGCGGSASQASSGGSTPSSSGNGGGQRNAIVRVGTNPKPGRILAGPNGHTLYLFTADRNGGSACSGACAETCPPLTSHGTGSSRAQGKVACCKPPATGTPYYAPDGKTGDVRGEGMRASAESGTHSLRTDTR